MRITRRRTATIAATAAAAALALSACGSGGGGEAVDDDTLLAWTLEVQPDRIAAQQAVLDDFTAESGIVVDLVPIEEAQVSQLLSAAALSGDMPDVIGSLPLGLVQSFAGDGYLDTDAAAAVVESLGADTWSEAALDLTQSDGDQLAVPSDAWAQILVYRTDLFEAAGLEPPTTYETLLEAADTLTSDGGYGISLATDPSDPFTQQTFEALALGNDCQLVDDADTVTLDSDACAETIDLYGQLSTEFSPDGTQTVDSTRASYFSGQSAMTIWSTFLLDELAGLRDDALPTCPECTTPGWLAAHTGVVPVVAGPDADEPGAFGEVSSWAITSEASTDDAQAFVEYMMDDGYEGWLGMAPEGKFPVRSGTADEPTRFTDAWATLPAGVDTRTPLADVYPADVIDDVTSGADGIERWALLQGDGDILGPIAAELPLAKVIADLASGSIDAASAQQQMQDAVAEIADR